MYTHDLPKDLADFLHQKPEEKYNRYEAFRFLIEMQARKSAESGSLSPVPFDVTLTNLSDTWGWHRHTVALFLEGLQRLGVVSFTKTTMYSTIVFKNLGISAV